MTLTTPSSGIRHPYNSTCYDKPRDRHWQTVFASASATMQRATMLLRTRLADTHLSSVVVSKVDFCCSVLAGIPGHRLDTLESVLNAVAHLELSMRRSEHITSPRYVIFTVCKTPRADTVPPLCFDASPSSLVGDDNILMFQRSDDKPWATVCHHPLQRRSSPFDKNWRHSYTIRVLSMTEQSRLIALSLAIPPRLRSVPVQSIRDSVTLISTF